MAQLHILDAILTRLEAQTGSGRPADHFDLVVGTGVGGLVALLLGRMDYPVQEVVRMFRELERKPSPTAARRRDSLRDEEELDAVELNPLMKVFPMDSLMDPENPCKVCLFL